MKFSISNPISLTVSLILSLLVVGCIGSRIKLGAKYEKDTDLNVYHTYYLKKLTPKDLAGMPHVTMDHLYIIEFSLRQEMADRGYKAASIDTADLLVGYNVLVNTNSKSSISTYQMGSSYGNPWIGYGGFFSPFTIDYMEYNSGTIVVDILDRPKKRLAWHGVAQGTVSEDAYGEDVELTIEKAMKQLFYRYKWSAGGEHK